MIKESLFLSEIKDQNIEFYRSGISCNKNNTKDEEKIKKTEEQSILENVKEYFRELFKEEKNLKTIEEVMNLICNKLYFMLEIKNRKIKKLENSCCYFYKQFIKAKQKLNVLSKNLFKIKNFEKNESFQNKFDNSIDNFNSFYLNQNDVKQKNVSNKSDLRKNIEDNFGGKRKSECQKTSSKLDLQNIKKLHQTFELKNNLNFKEINSFESSQKKNNEIFSKKKKTNFSINENNKNEKVQTYQRSNTKQFETENNYENLETKNNLINSNQAKKSKLTEKKKLKSVKTKKTKNEEEEEEKEKEEKNSSNFSNKFKISNSNKKINKCHKKKYSNQIEPFDNYVKPPINKKIEEKIKNNKNKSSKINQISIEQIQKNNQPSKKQINLKYSSSHKNMKSHSKKISSSIKYPKFTQKENSLQMKDKNNFYSSKKKKI